MGEFENLIPEFIEESLEHLKHIEEDIIQIEQGQADEELINSVFRAVHSVKGGSSFLGLKNIEKLSHKMEDIFNLVRNGKLTLTSSISTKILNSIDKLKEMLDDSSSSDTFDIASNIKDMEDVISSNNDASISEEIHISAFNSHVQMSKYKFDSYKKKSKNVFLLRMEFVEGNQYKNILDFLKEIGKIGEIVENEVDIECLMSSDNFTGNGIPLKIIYASVLDIDLVIHTFGITKDDIVEIKEENVASETPEIKIDNIVKQEKAVESNPVNLVSTEDDDEDEEEDIEIIRDENEFMTFLIGEEEYGIGIKLIQEIVTMQSITDVPGSSDYTKGIINLRGDILPVYDFRLKLNFEAREYDGETVILIISMSEKKFGIIVDRISEVVHLNENHIKDAPNMRNIPSNFVLGIGQKDDKFIILLKVKEMIIGTNVA